MKKSKQRDAAEREQNFKEKYRSYYFRKKEGITLPVAKKILEYVFKESFKTVVPNHHQCTFDVMLFNSVDKIELNRFKDYWEGVFTLYCLQESTNKK